MYPSLQRCCWATPAPLCVVAPTAQATSHEDLKRLLSKAQAIDELESTMPAFIERLMPANYPAYVHVLRVRGVLKLGWDRACPCLLLAAADTTHMQEQQAHSARQPCTRQRPSCADS
jgi:hypothetical protein